MKIVHLDGDPGRDLDLRCGEPLFGQAVVAVFIGTRLPGFPLKKPERKHRELIDTIALRELGGLRLRYGLIGVARLRFELHVIIKIFLHQRDIKLVQQRTDERDIFFGIGGRNPLRQSGHVISQ